jgi:hypothetical protein
MLRLHTCDVGPAHHKKISQPKPGTSQASITTIRQGKGFPVTVVPHLKARLPDDAVGGGFLAAGQAHHL